MTPLTTGQIMTMTTMHQASTQAEGIQPPSTPQKPPQQSERTAVGELRVGKSPRVDSLKEKATESGPKTTMSALSSSIPVPTRSAMQVPKSQGPGQQMGDRHASSTLNPFISEPQWEPPPHFPLALAFSSLHQHPNTLDAQTGQQCSTLMSHLPCILEWL